MTEKSTSRFGIIDDMNNRIIEGKKQLADLERMTDSHVFDVEKEVSEFQRKIEDRENNYKRSFEDWKKQKELEKRLLESKYKRKIQEMVDIIQEREDNYEHDFIQWKAELQKEIDFKNTALNRYKEVQTKKIKTHQELIDEMKQGIVDLKDVSSGETSKTNDETSNTGEEKKSEK